MLVGALLCCVQAKAWAMDEGQQTPILPQITSQVIQNIVNDASFEQHKQTVQSMLKQRGYALISISAVAYVDKITLQTIPALQVIAQKHGKSHQITIHYPSLKILKEKMQFEKTTDTMP